MGPHTFRDAIAKSPLGSAVNRNEEIATAPRRHIIQDEKKAETLFIREMMLCIVVEERTERNEDTYYAGLSHFASVTITEVTFQTRFSHERRFFGSVFFVFRVFHLNLNCLLLNMYLGGLGFTTPSMTRTSSSNTNANAGPSTRPTAAKSAKRQRTSLSPSQSLGDQGNPVMIEDDAEMGDERGKKGKSGKAAINGKGKGKTAAKNSRVAHKSTGPRVAPVAQADESEDDARPANGISELARIRQALDDVRTLILQRVCI